MRLYLEALSESENVQAMSADICLEMLRLIEADSKRNETSRKEILVSYLRTIFPQPGYQGSIDGIAGGAEEYVRTLPSSVSGSTYGFMDTRNGKLIIEFKDNLLNTSSLQTAEGELRKYVASIWSSYGIDSTYCCIATDVLRWRIYRPIPRNISENAVYSADQVEIELVETIDVSRPNTEKASHLFHLLERVLFKENLQILTAETLKRNFGLSSNQYAIYRTQIDGLVEEAQKNSEVALAIRLWHNFQAYNSKTQTLLSITSYGGQIYLVILARLIVAALFIERDSEDSDREIKSVLDGKFFRYTLGLNNFVERDFFGWFSDEPWIGQLLPIARQIFHNLRAYDLSASGKDNMIRLIYDELMPDQHSSLLGQRSTPRALVEPIVDQVLSGTDGDFYYLDPACGSGNFLYSVIQRVKSELIAQSKSNTEIVNDIVRRIQGIDIDPVAVILAKSMWVLALSDLLSGARGEITIPIYHADSLFVAGSEKGGADEKAEVAFDNTKIKVPEGLFEYSHVFDSVVAWCNKRALAHTSNLSVSDELPSLGRQDVESAISRILSDTDQGELNRGELIEFAILLTNELARRMHEKRNGIWAFIIRNSYRPSLFAGKFDVIATNPPWLVMSSIPDVPYKKELEDLAEYFNIKPKGSSALHTEIATTFILRSVAHFLKDGAVCAFVMPRSIFDGDQHIPFRNKKYLDRVSFSIHEVWDLENVDGLFKIPSCVIFGSKDVSLGISPAYKTPINADFVAGNVIPDFSVTSTLRTKYMGEKNAWSSNLVLNDSLLVKSSYSVGFKQGADLMPRTAVFVDRISDKPGESFIAITTSGQERGNRNNKILKDEVFSGIVCIDFLFRTLTSSNLVPFYIEDAVSTEICLPAKFNGNDLNLVSQEELYNSGDLDTAEWFARIDQALGDKKIRERVNTRGKLTQQSFCTSGLIVLYGAGGSLACAGLYSNDVNDRRKLVIDQTLYGYAVDSPEEGYYLVGMINSSVIASRIEAFQSKGVFGERHVHKLPLSLMPPFDSFNDQHKLLAEKARLLEGRVSELHPEGESLARKRTVVRDACRREIDEIDRIVDLILA